MRRSLLAFTFLSLLCFDTGYGAEDLFHGAGEDRIRPDQAHSPQPGFPASGSEATKARTQAPGLESESQAVQAFALIEISRPDEGDRDRDTSSSNFKRLKRAETISLGAQILGMGLFQAGDVWHTGRRPFSDARDNLRRAWTTAPAWDEDSHFYNYIGHPYTGAFTYNLMRSQEASPLASWLFSCSQSLIWEFTLEATEQQPSVQDLLFTSNIGSLMGEGFHRLTKKLKKDGLSWKEKVIILVLNPAHLLNNGFR